VHNGSKISNSETLCAPEKKFLQTYTSRKYLISLLGRAG